MKFTPLAPRLTRNAIRCKACGAEIESARRSEFRSCACGAVAVDGGLDAPRHIGDPALIEDLSEHA